MNAQPTILRRFITLVIVLLLLLGVTGPGQSAVASSLAQSFIVQGQSTEAVARLVEHYGGTVTSRLDIINGVGADLTEASKAALDAEPSITAITANSKVEKAGGVPETDYPDVTGATLCWDEGANGSGIAVAVVDTGLGRHPGLSKDVNGKNKDRITGWIDFVDHSRKPVDPNGHGTHIAGIIANTQIGSDGEWNGMAPGVNLVGVRVLNEEGYGNYEQIIQGIDWVVAHKDELNIRVMNLSLLADVTAPYWADPLNQAVMEAWQAGIVVVAAAGNSGPDPMTVKAPGNVPYVITVGAFTDNYTPDNWTDDYITEFSAAGPTLDAFVKPDIIAPGAHMASPLLAKTALVTNETAKPVGKSYYSMAGTSQAAAAVSGVAALILSEHPELTPDEVKYRLQVTALPWITSDANDTLYSVWQQGSGRLNAYDAAFADLEGASNAGMDIAADLAGEQHYEGYSYYDSETGQYRLRGDFSAWSGAYGAWSGAYGAWSGAYGAWSGAYGAWSGAYGAWSGAYGAWSGAYGAWSGAYGAWSGGYSDWTGEEPWAGSVIGQEGFVADFLNGVSPAMSTTSSLGLWVEE